MVAIRPVTPADAHPVAALHARSWQHAYAGIIPDVVLDHLATRVDQRAEHFRQRWSDPQHPLRSLVAYEGDELAGFVTYGPYRTKDEPPPAPTAGEVYAIYLDPSHIGRGVGRLLLDAAVAGLRQQQWREVRLWVLEENWPARRFYQRYGFTPDGQRQMFRPTTPDGTLVEVPELRYALQLAPGSASPR
jgi:ribosomal protein S18 acetylase RimI-like enzyme